MLGAAVEALPVYGLTLSRSIRAIERRIVGMLRAVVGAWDQVGGSCPHFHLPPDLTLLPPQPPTVPRYALCWNILCFSHSVLATVWHLVTEQM